MRVIVTGASGFIGRNVLLRAPRDWEILALYHQTSLESFVAEHDLSHVRPLRCDLLDDDAVRSLGRSVGGGADAVLHLAANGDPAVSAERPRWDLESSTVTLVNVLEHCSAGHFVYVSSGAVYDGLIGPVSPESSLSPLLPYAIAKLASEQYVRFFAERRRTLGSYINVRFFGAYGPYEPPRKITTRWLRAIADGRREFTIRGDGENLIDFMYVDDAADGLLRLTAAAGASLTVDFASGTPITVNDVVQTLARLCGVSVSLKHDGRADEYIQFRSVDSTLRDRFGVKPSIPFEEGLRRLRAFCERTPRATSRI